jgi:hypothetical protein
MLTGGHDMDRLNNAVALAAADTLLRLYSTADILLSIVETAKKQNDEA